MSSRADACTMDGWGLVGSCRHAHLLALAGMHICIDSPGWDCIGQRMLYIFSCQGQAGSCRHEILGQMLQHVNTLWHALMMCLRALPHRWLCMAERPSSSHDSLPMLPSLSIPSMPVSTWADVALLSGSACGAASRKRSACEGGSRRKQSSPARSPEC